MEKQEKIINALQFYLLATELKDKIREGWKVWHVNKERLESIAEHIYGTCILAIAIDSEFELNLDLQKTVIMLVLHELEEVEIGDITPFDNITLAQKREMGKKAVENILESLTKKYEYIELLEEFEEMETKEAKFAKVCDKLEADLQCKIYCENKQLDMNSDKNKQCLQNDWIKELMKKGCTSTADLFIEHDRYLFSEPEMEEILNFVKEHKLEEFERRAYEG